MFYSVFIFLCDSINRELIFIQFTDDKSTLDAKSIRKLYFNSFTKCNPTLPYRVYFFVFLYFISMKRLLTALMLVHVGNKKGMEDWKSFNFKT